MIITKFCDYYKKKVILFNGDNMKKLFVCLLTLIVFLSAAPKVYAEQEAKPLAKSSILMSLDTGEVLSENNSHERLAPASVTKIMSLLLIFEALDSGKIGLNDMVTADEKAVSMGGSQIWLEVGESMSVDDLLKAVIIASANDACTLLSSYVAGSDTAFVDMMNEKVRDLGLKDTNFENCTGLDDTTTNHYSSAYDLAVISREVMKYDYIYNYSTVWLDYLRDGKTELNNTNKLVNTYEGITGLKTGTTSNAGYCVCATATREDMSLVAVVMGAETSDDRFSLASDLLDYGFENYKLVNLDIDPELLTPVKVKLGTVKYVKPSLDIQNKILLPKNASDPQYNISVSESINAPVRKGDSLGSISVNADGKEICVIPLYCDTDISEISFKSLFINIIKNI